MTAESTAESSVEPTVAAGPVRAHGLRTVVGHALTVLAVLAIFVALIMPNAGSRDSAGGHLRSAADEGFLARLVLLLPFVEADHRRALLGAGLAA